MRSLLSVDCGRRKQNINRDVGNMGSLGLSYPLGWSHFIAWGSHPLSSSGLSCPSILISWYHTSPDDLGLHLPSFARKTPFRAPPSQGPPCPATEKRHLLPDPSPRPRSGPTLGPTRGETTDLATQPTSGPIPDAPLRALPAPALAPLLVVTNGGKYSKSVLILSI